MRERNGFDRRIEPAVCYSRGGADHQRNGGLPRVSIATPVATAEIYLHGAQVTSWRPAGQEEVIFLSRQSQFEAGKAIRGGIPVCFPWFRNKVDDPKAPSHGVVRTKAWELDGGASWQWCVGKPVDGKR